MKKTLLAALAVFATAHGNGVLSQSWPSRPIRVVVPFTAGGGVDSAARITTSRLSGALGQQLIVDNRPGGRAVIGAEMVSKASPDGYTLLAVSESLTIMPFVESKLPFDVRRSFTPVSLLAIQPQVLVVHPALPALSVKEFIALAKSKPGFITYGSGGFGQYLGGELLKKAADFDMRHIPYKGGAQAITDLVGGQLQAGVLGLSVTMNFARSGKVRILAVSTNSRSAVLPDVPTLLESGVSGVDVYQWVFMLAPAGVPRGVVTRLNTDLKKVLASQDVKEKLQSAGYDAAPSTPQHLDGMIKEALERWAQLIPALKIKPE
jgi:tripartite-type tricarboxylate transporter receptor subunit TctC